MTARLRRAEPAEVAAALARVRAGDDQATDLRLLSKHFLAVLVDRAPGGSVEVRVPPFAVAQCVAGSRHTRGTPPAVVEADPATWVALAAGDLTWDAAAAAYRLSASGERADLRAYLPLT